MKKLLVVAKGVLITPTLRETFSDFEKIIPVGAGLMGERFDRIAYPFTEPPFDSMEQLEVHRMWIEELHLKLYLKGELVPI